MKIKVIILSVFLLLLIVYTAGYIFVLVDGKRMLVMKLEEVTHKKASVGYFRFSPPFDLHVRDLAIEGTLKLEKADISLSLPYLAGALREAGYDVKILDVAVGDEDQSLEDAFFSTTMLPSSNLSLLSILTISVNFALSSILHSPVCSVLLIT